MRIRASASFSVLFLSLATPLLLHAQFQEPTKSELQIASDPLAPGAAAVYLYREEQDLGTKREITYYDRIKVLTEKGKEAATISIPYVRGYGKIAKVEGRTIHADGTVIPLTATPDDLMDVKTKNFQKRCGDVHAAERGGGQRSGVQGGDSRCVGGPAAMEPATELFRAQGALSLRFCIYRLPA